QAGVPRRAFGGPYERVGDVTCSRSQGARLTAAELAGALVRNPAQGGNRGLHPGHRVGSRTRITVDHAGNRAEGDVRDARDVHHRGAPGDVAASHQLPPMSRILVDPSGTDAESFLFHGLTSAGQGLTCPKKRFYED